MEEHGQRQLGADGSPEAWAFSKDDAGHRTGEVYRLRPYSRGKVTDLRTALLSRYPTDAHLCQYVVANEDLTFRVTKDSLASLLKYRVELLFTVVLIDLDFPAHKKGNVARYPELLGFVRREVQKTGLADPYIYMTRGGARLAWELTTPWKMDRGSDREIEARLAGIRRRLRLTALPMEFDICDGCKDWTHLFRLPRVVRDGIALDFPMDVA